MADDRRQQLIESFCDMLAEWCAATDATPTEVVNTGLRVMSRYTAGCGVSKAHAIECFASHFDPLLHLAAQQPKESN